MLIKAILGNYVSPMSTCYVAIHEAITTSSLIFWTSTESDFYTA